MTFDRRPAILRCAATRRSFMKGLSASMALTAAPPLAWARGKTGLHGLSAFGDLKYARDFKHLDYVNPKAPRGGQFNFIPSSWAYNQNYQTFNTLNGYAARGDGPMGVEICFDSLLVGTADEPDAVYGLVAETISVSDDGNVFIFHMRKTARFSDGTPITAEDVVFSIDTLIDPLKGYPSISQTLSDLTGCRALDDHTVEISFNGEQSLFGPFSAASLPIFSKAFYQGHDFVGNTMDRPITSGAYRFGELKPGTFIEYNRMDDYWGKDLPINIGQGNFDVVRIEFYRDWSVGFQAFTKGDLDFRLEDTAKNWATQYEFTAVKQKKVIKTTFPGDKSAILQAFFINTRRSQFSDPKTREALGLAFDYEWINETFFYGSYTRSHSYFATSTYEARGKPQGAELALLEPFREELGPRVFSEAVTPPISDGTGRDRKKLKQALELLREAGWKRINGIQTKADGSTLDLEFLIRSRSFERVLAPYMKNLELIGVNATLRHVEAAQYNERVRNYDFDVVGQARRFSATPLQGFRAAFSSKAADLPGTGNLSGIKSSAIDALIDAVEKAKNREEMETAARALDRVLRASFYTIPNWHIDIHRVAYWNKFGLPEGRKPDYAFPYLTTWWYDTEKAKLLES